MAVHTVTRGSLTFTVREQGAGEPVVLLHGFPEDAVTWARVEPALAAAGYRTLAPDQRGYAPGARPAGRRAYALRELCSDVLALLDARGIERAHLVGHDWGGGVAWALAAQRPDRIATLTVLSTPHPGALRRALWRSDQALRSTYMALLQVPVLPERFVARDLARSLRSAGLNPVDAARYGRRFADPAELTGPMNWYRALPFAGRPVGPVSVPTTYVWGNRDAFLGRTAAESTERFVRAPYRFLELDAPHWLPQERPAEVAQAIIERARAVPLD